MKKYSALLYAFFVSPVISCAQQSAGQIVIDPVLPDTRLANVNSMQNTDGWKLVWSDEFSATEIDKSKWGYDIDCWGGGNNERQCYTDSPRNAAIEDGKLVITARKEKSTGPALPPHMTANSDNLDATKTQPFSSARLTTKRKAAWRYGRIDIRAKLPHGQGTWPAIWMLPEDSEYGSWAASGEIDIMEAVNWGVRCASCPGGRENTLLGTLHFGDKWPDNKHSGTEVAMPGSIDEFHTYSIVWNEGSFVWFVDGKAFATKSATEWSTTSSDNPNAPFDKSFHLILNLAIGGGLPEERGLKGVSEEGFPKRFEVDFVRVWKCKPDAASDKTCMIRGK